MRGIPIAPDAITASAEGFNEMVDRMPVLTRIHVHYTLAVPPDASPEKVDRALETHVAKCPTARSLKGAIDISWSVDRLDAPAAEVRGYDEDL